MSNIGIYDQKTMQTQGLGHILCTVLKVVAVNFPVANFSVKEHKTGPATTTQRIVAAGPGSIICARFCTHTSPGVRNDGTARYTRLQTSA